MAPRLTIVTLIAGWMGLAASPATAQYYTPPQQAATQGHQPGGVGLDLGLRDGVYPTLGAGIGSVGAGVGAGVGLNGIGLGVSGGAGPVGLQAQTGVSAMGAGLRTSAGVGSSTGAALDIGATRGGIGAGGRLQLLGFGPGASIGLGDDGPGLGASLAFGHLGTVNIGQTARGPVAPSYPGSDATLALQPHRAQTYYAPRSYGNAPYYVPVSCPVGWTCS